VFLLSMHPDEGGWIDAMRLEYFDLLERRHRPTGVRCDGQPGLSMREGGGVYQLEGDIGKVSVIHTDLHEAGLHGCSVDAGLPLLYPSLCQLFGGLRERMLRQELVIRSAVVAGVGHDKQPRL